MITQAISSPDGSFFDPNLDKEYLETESLAQRVQSIWAKIYDLTVGNLVKIVHIVRSAIGSFVRDAFFFPLKWPVIANRQEVRDQLQIEEDYSRNFWDPSKPLDSNFSEQAKIREMFLPPQDQTFSIQLGDGRSAKITCRIMQTKATGDHFYNFIQVPGIYGTIDNNIAGSYAYLAAYLNAETGESPLPPARFIVLSENNLNFKPATLEEAGFALLQTLKALKEEFGEIDQLVAHSLGNIFLASALKQIDDPKILPKHLCLDRGPSSLWEASKKYFWGFGRLSYCLAKIGGWTTDLEQEVLAFCQKWKERPHFVVSGVIQDHYFSGDANLCLGNKIQEIEGIHTLVFDPPRQVFHQHAHHNLRSDFLNSRYLTNESNFMNSSENFAEALIRHSLPVIEENKQQIA